MDGKEHATTRSPPTAAGSVLSGSATVFGGPGRPKGPAWPPSFTSESRPPSATNNWSLLIPSSSLSIRSRMPIPTLTRHHPKTSPASTSASANARHHQRGRVLTSWAGMQNFRNASLQVELEYGWYPKNKIGLFAEPIHCDTNSKANCWGNMFGQTTGSTSPTASVDCL